MFRIAALCLALTALPVAAQEQDNRRMIEEGVDLFLRGLMGEMEPAMRDLAEGLESLRELEPELRELSAATIAKLRDLAQMIGEFDSYHPPERLPNGDIILRRKTPEAAPEAEPAPEGQIEL